MNDGWGTGLTFTKTKPTTKETTIRPYRKRVSFKCFITHSPSSSTFSLGKNSRWFESTSFLNETDITIRLLHPILYSSLKPSFPHRARLLLSQVYRSKTDCY